MKQIMFVDSDASILSRNTNQALEKLYNDGSVIESIVPISVRRVMIIYVIPIVSSL